MANHNLMNDPYFAQLMVRVETCIHQADQEARELGEILPKDSSVKSAIRKAQLALGGKKPVKPPKDGLEIWILALSDSLMELAKELGESDGVSKGDFLKTLGATKESLGRQREMANSPRGYLKFLDGFMKKMNKS